MATRLTEQLIGNREKALIHVAKQQLGMDETTYRDMLASVGCESSKQLTRAKFDDVMRRMEAGGFRPIHKSARKSGMDKPAADSKEPLLKKVGAILADCRLPWRYAEATAQNMFGVERLPWLTPTQLHKLVAALSVYQKRRRKKEEAAHGER